MAGEIRDLGKLIQELALVNSIPELNPQITGISIDSRKIQPGALFLAIQGTQVDGHQYIREAVSRGAAAVVGSASYQQYQDLSVPYIQVRDSREALAGLTAAWFDYPARKLIVIGVTGTDGKTTTVNLIYQILISAGLRAGLISTVNAIIGDQILDTGFHVTTPEAIDVQYYLSEMVKAGITHVVLEATSHGLAQKRIAACEVDIAVVTNVTHEHLDYHGDYQRYLQAKAELFRLAAASRKKSGRYQKTAILNKDDQSFQFLKTVTEQVGLDQVDYGIANQAAYQAANISSELAGLSFDLVESGQRTRISTSLIGEYNISNCLAASAACLSGLGLSREAVQVGIKNLPGIPGRMEQIDLGQNFLALVDFAHTPNALRQAISAGKALSSRHVIAVFGSAGLRDQEKRRLMAEVSAELADLTILTAEDPRTESLDEILNEMAAGMISRGRIEGKTFWRVPDRRQAIRFALQQASAGDVVLICGKGHEQSMCFAEIEYPWDDRTALKSALAEYLEKEGPEMPYLPTREE